MPSGSQAWFLLSDQVAIRYEYPVIPAAESSLRARPAADFDLADCKSWFACVARAGMLGYGESTNSWPTSAIIKGVARYNRRTFSI
jgi:hypothetical protein